MAAQAEHLLSCVTCPPSSAQRVIDALPAPTARALAKALGLAGSARAALSSTVAWSQKYKYLFAKHGDRCREEFKKKAPSARAGGALDAAVHIVQHEAGSGVVVGPEHVLTCAHCVCADDDPNDDDDEEPDEDPPRMIDRVGRMKLLFCTDASFAVGVCVAADDRKDLALLRIVASSAPGKARSWLRVGTVEKKTRVVCVGNPSEFNLEEGGRIHFKPPLFHSSSGSIVGRSSPDVVAAKGLGPWRHTAWTYWGHSGAPLIDAEGKLVGLHNSWDDELGSRHGIGADEIVEFLRSAGIETVSAPTSSGDARSAEGAAGAAAGSATSASGSAGRKRGGKRTRDAWELPHEDE